MASGSKSNLTLAEVKSGPNFHSEHNLFPIGYISVRTYSSMFHKGQKAEYTCEILDGADKPIYRVTSSDDPNNPIVRVAFIDSRIAAQDAGCMSVEKSMTSQTKRSQK